MSATVPKWSPTFVPINPTHDAAVSTPSSPALIRVVSYNILAQCYVKSAAFPHSPSSCLRLKARSQAVLARLLSFNADFLCLQELDLFESFYKDLLDKKGYSSVYAQRSGGKHDGCGIFFRRARFKLVAEKVIDYNDLVPCSAESDPAEALSKSEVPAGSSPTADVQRGLNPRKARSNRSLSPVRGSEARGDPNDPCVRLKRDCVGIMAAFCILDAPKNIVLLGNTHLYWDPAWADVKLAQARYLLSCLLEFHQRLSSKFDNSAPMVIVTGDYNSVPGDQVYRYLTSGLEENCPSQQYNGSEEHENEQSFEDTFSNLGDTRVSSQDNSIADPPSTNGREDWAERASLPLVSLYAQVQGEPPFTNVTPGFTGTLDYIFFQPSACLQPHSLLVLPTPGSPDIEGGLPNHNHPSDHLPIGADFALY